MPRTTDLRATFPFRSSPRLLPALAVLAALALLPACSMISASPQTRGNMVQLDDLKELVPGTSTRADAMSLLGSPTAKASFDDNRWIYIGEVTRPRIGRIQGVVRQQVVLLDFDDKGVLRHVQRLNQKNALPVEVVSRETPTPGSHASFFQQLFGNLGHYNPLAAGQPAGPATGGLNGGTPAANTLMP